MVDPIDNKHVSPDLKATYKNEFARGVKLFQDSLSEYEKADEVHKKAKFKDVMDKALNIMNQSARGFLTTESERQKGQEVKNQILTDYQSYLANDNGDTYKKLQSDINNLKRFT